MLKLPLLKTLPLALAVSLFTSTACAQRSSDQVVVFGKVSASRDDSDFRVVKGGEILVTSAGDSVFYTTDARGKYSCNLEYDRVYKMHFSSDGLCSKYVEISTENIPHSALKGGFKLHIDMSLPNDATAQQVMILEDFPIGKASYDKKADNLIFDLKHTKRIRAFLERGNRKL